MPVQRLLNFVANRRTRAYRVPDGRRVYAVGDIHGRLDLLDELLAKIEADNMARDPRDVLVVFLGDLVDRGPDSRGVVDRLIDYKRGPIATRFLMGNHEEVFLRAIGGDPKSLKFLLRIGGRATVMSYGVSEQEYRELDFEALAAVLQARVPAEHVTFLSSFEESVEAGDYLFVHAGVRPGVDLAEQRPSDLRWIRDDFLQHRDDFGKFVVHGHSITQEIDVRANRVGIDTGAYETGRLSAIGLEGAERWFLST
ncbi:metallophosphoesterase family protein [Sphingosinicella sp. LHD-64]|uniref:metallophosphoesterase family protein n=1 Tax=Sphingosinicella sp. LHD-64 TaxID=3072139 RepID=UPI0028101EAE|nr:metallophosphoesterase family protein [Sphingosinicella sp. LHD-64]MDQ8757212.1 metallophosphoesterase family protein [Sphingosinicella sp. LHD-64]